MDYKTKGGLWLLDAVSLPRWGPPKYQKPEGMEKDNQDRDQVSQTLAPYEDNNTDHNPCVITTKESPLQFGPYKISHGPQSQRILTILPHRRRLYTK